MGCVLSKPRCIQSCTSSRKKSIVKEKEAWKQEHALKCDPELANEQEKLILNNFSSPLFLCFENQKMYGVQYKQHFVTDQTWTIEFVGGEKHSSAVLINDDPRAQPYYFYENLKFELTDEVMERMKSVCGATNFSLILRNSEHLARYITDGCWLSLQTAGECVFKEKFITKMDNEEKIYLNTIPLDLRPVRPRSGKLYESITHHSFSFEENKETLDKRDDDKFNIVLIGPTGCGKSSIINLLFNETVTEASTGAKSVTKDLKFCQGKGFFKEVRQRREVINHHRVNVIDTVGLCDSEINEDELFKLVKKKLETNLLHIDRVAIVCSGRLEINHQDAIKQFMKWLKYKKYSRNFVFIYNKCENMTEAQKLHSAADVSTMLEIDMSITNTLWNFNDETDEINTFRVESFMTSGIPPTSPYEEIKAQADRLSNRFVVPTYKDKNSQQMENRIRIPLDTSKGCTIL